MHLIHGRLAALVRASVALATVGALLAGCATPEPILSSTVAPVAQAGYVAGQFRRGKAMSFALVIQGRDHPERSYTMAMGEWGLVPSAAEEHSVAIQVEPGTYYLKEWITYGTLVHGVLTRKAFPESAVIRSFEVRAGQVVDVGSWDLSYPHGAGGIYAQVVLHPAQEADVHAAFERDYASFAGLPFHCMLCTDTVGEWPRN